MDPLHRVPVEPQTQALLLQMLADVPHSVAVTQVTQDPEPLQTPSFGLTNVHLVPLAA